eukprot:TRINITY_DN7888_c0_g1_i1.p1 TRINITY_DN7888_c0_g1~~TRINITY_DN7888_c0_g1_i1.p1  ORF type:complete len:156 (-),score=30.92 TRINITY_DN7888_c0_g1_i1:48-515(-)
MNEDKVGLMALFVFILCIGGVFTLTGESIDFEDIDDWEKKLEEFSLYENIQEYDETRGVSTEFIAGLLLSTFLFITFRYQGAYNRTEIPHREGRADFVQRYNSDEIIPRKKVSLLLVYILIGVLIWITLFSLTMVKLVSFQWFIWNNYLEDINIE